MTRVRPFARSRRGVGRVSLAAAATLVVVAGSLAGARTAGAVLTSGGTHVEPIAAHPSSTCERWVAPNGGDRNPGTERRPWATLRHAAKHVRDRGCTVWLEDGVYSGNSDLDRRFHTQTTFRAVHPYRAVLQGNGSVLDLGGSAHMTFRGLEVRQSGPGASGSVVYVGNASHMAFKDCIFHDSYDNDIMTILDGSDSVSVRGSVFYNQGPNEQHIDVNSVTNVRIVGNVFFNDYAASGRAEPGNTKAFIVVKDSNENEDGLLGARGIHIERNVFLNWEGGFESYLQVGNDGKPYFEARNVHVVDNLLIGNSTEEVWSSIVVSGVRDVTFLNNTVVGDLPADSYAMHVDIKDANPRNEDIRFWNNVWCDPTGTMGTFSGGDPSNTTGLALDRNLYWNGGVPIPGGDLVSPMQDDRHRVVKDPRLPTDQSGVVLPVWDGSVFASGNRTIGEEFVRLVETYGKTPENSPAVGRAARSRAPTLDILGNRRDSHPDLGAYEA